ncbi:hypothetical protein [Chitinophaga pinensis]|uniref:hypothetical protein n=1 Tax=Chitinophaga pinensis TaxID=79329 RepID=UPI001646BF19|nr:hypothetical protein [Chitinophaga pinensis]
MARSRSTDERDRRCPVEIENPRITGINKEAAHATLMPYSNLTEALKGNRRASSAAFY